MSDINRLTRRDVWAVVCLAVFLLVFMVIPYAICLWLDSA